MDKAIAIIKQFEGCKLKAYLDSGTPPVVTIGYGTTVYKNGVKVKMGDEISKNDAEWYLDLHCEGMQKSIKESLKFPDLLNENQMAAICSWTYNIGNAAEAHSTLIKKLNQISPLTATKEQWEAIGDMFLAWDVDNGKHVPGLHNRRVMERALFLS